MVIALIQPQHHPNTFVADAFHVPSITFRRQQVVSFAISVEEETERDLSQLGDWATHFGIVGSDGFTLVPTSEDDWAAEATMDLPKNSQVLQVPQDIILSSPAIRLEIGEEKLKSALEFLKSKGIAHQTGQFLLFLKILMEYEKEEESFWYVWLNALPRKFYTAVSMDDFEISCLPPFLYSLSMMDRIHFSVFLEAMPYVSDIFMYGDQITQDINLLKWVFNVVYTRCWGLDDERCDIVPMADMFDHAYPGQCCHKVR